MAQNRVLPINDFSDGDGRSPQTSRMFREDAYFLARLGDAWAKDTGLPRPPGLVYTIDRLPAGYSGWGSRREGSTHVDRYLWGHPNGQFRSINEAFPHFKYLMDRPSAPGIVCFCPRCGNKTSVKGPSKPLQLGINATSDDLSILGSASKRSSPFMKPPARPNQNQALLQTVRFSSSDEAPPLRRKQVDEDGVADVYRALLDRLQSTGPEGSVDEALSEPFSPDAYASSKKLTVLLQKWQDRPPFHPRIGELVLFVRHLKTEDTIHWSPSAKKFRVYDTAIGVWIDQPVWEAGVISQESIEPCNEADLGCIPINKKTNINQSGFKIEPLSAPQQHLYAPLHAIRPLAFWQYCTTEKELHPTVIAAITASKSFCVIEKFHFKGTWPNATIFAKALYLGSELIIVGDLVRFLNDLGEVDMLKVTSIKLVMLDLDGATKDDWDDRRPYKTVLHVSGHAYSLEPTRSFDIIGKVPASTYLPSGLPEAPWFHVTDPAKPKMRVEIPYSRVISRYPGDAAIAAWFESPLTPATSFQPVNVAAKPVADARTRISRGVIGTLDARKFSELHCPQIARSEGKTWFWADTRVEQLSLKEVNGRPVGAGMITTDEEQTRAELMPLWRSALTSLQGKHRNVEPWRTSDGGDHRSAHSAFSTNSHSLATRGLQKVVLPHLTATDQNDVNHHPMAGMRMEGGNNHPSSPSGSKRSHSDMDVDDEDDKDVKLQFTSERRPPSPPTLQRRIETIEIEDSD